MRKNLLNILMSFIITLSFNYMGWISNNIFFSLIVFILILLILNMFKIDFDVKNDKLLLGICILFSLFTVIGKDIQNISNNYDLNFLSTFFTLGNLISIIGLILLFYVILYIIFNIKINIKSNKNYSVSKKKILIFMGLILLIWVIYFIAYYPGNVSSDGTDILMQALKLKKISNHHPVVYTLLIRCILDIFSFFSINTRVAIFIFFQMLFMAFVFSLITYEIDKKYKNKLVTVVILLFYMFCPLYGLFSVTLLKDTIFGGLFLLFIYKIYYFKNYDVKTIDYFIFGLIILFLSLFRSNAIYVVILSIPFIIKSIIKYKKGLIITLLITISIFFIIKIPIFNILNIKDSSSAEYLAIPLQQVSRIVVKNGDINNKDKKIIENIISYKDIKNNYNPYTVDTIKFNKNFNADYLTENMKDFITMYGNLVINNPMLSIESYFCSTLAYWYPNLNSSYFIISIYENDFGLYRSNSMNFITNKVNILFTNNNVLYSILSIFYNIALWVWVLIILFVYTLKYNKDKIVYFIPMLLLLLSLMVATPDYGELRYIYGIICTLPFICGIIIDKK